MANERTCTVCGTQYKYCKRCRQYEMLPTWMFAYCSENCKNTYMAINQYDFEHISAKEALDIVDALKVKIVNPTLTESYKKMKKEAKKAVEREKEEETSEN